MKHSLTVSMSKNLVMRLLCTKNRSFGGIKEEDRSDVQSINDRSLRKDEKYEKLKEVYDFDGRGATGSGSRPAGGCSFALNKGSFETQRDD